MIEIVKYLGGKKNRFERGRFIRFIATVLAVFQEIEVGEELAKPGFAVGKRGI